MILIARSSRVEVGFESFPIQYLEKVYKIEVEGENKMHIKNKKMKIRAFPEFVKLFKYLRIFLTQNGVSQL